MSTQRTRKAAPKPPKKGTPPAVEDVAGPEDFASRRYEELVRSGVRRGEALARAIEEGALPKFFYLRVLGDGLRSSGIVDGDLILCRARTAAKRGAIACILIDRRLAQVGRYHRDRSGVIRMDLDGLEPSRYERGRALLWGVVEGVYRAYTPPASTAGEAEPREE